MHRQRGQDLAKQHLILIKITAYIHCPVISINLQGKFQQKILAIELLSAS